MGPSKGRVILSAVSGFSAAMGFDPHGYHDKLFRKRKKHWKETQSPEERDERLAKAEAKRERKRLRKQQNK